MREAIAQGLAEGFSAVTVTLVLGFIAVKRAWVMRKIRRLVSRVLDRSVTQLQVAHATGKTGLLFRRYRRMLKRRRKYRIIIAGGTSHE